MVVRARLGPLEELHSLRHESPRRKRTSPRWTVRLNSRRALLVLLPLLRRWHEPFHRLVRSRDLRTSAPPGGRPHEAHPDQEIPSPAREALDCPKPAAIQREVDLSTLVGIEGGDDGFRDGVRADRRCEEGDEAGGGVDGAKEWGADVAWDDEGGADWCVRVAVNRSQRRRWGGSEDGPVAKLVLEGLVETHESVLGGRVVGCARAVSASLRREAE